LFDLKNLWNKRFHGWYWLLLPILALLALSLLSIWLGWEREPAPSEWILRVLIAIGCLALTAVGLWQVGRTQQELLQVLRNLANGRAEARASLFWDGATGELAALVNALGKALIEARDVQNSTVQQALVRLRQDHERLQELNTELRRSLRESRDAARMQSELFSNLSHELRTPLTAVLGYADLLRKSGLRAEQEQHLATLDRSARGMLTMINDLLDWSRIEAGKLRLHADSFDLLSTVEDTTALLAPLAYDKNLELVRIFYHDVPRKLRGDAQRLRQIITNLVSNAIKFTHRGEVVVRVMRERDENDRVWLRFSISDSGIGIDPEQQRALFQPFQQAGRSVGGSGLGLSITRRLCELMGGKVELDSQLNRGSTFSALLPFADLSADHPSPVTDTRLRERSVWVLEPHPTARLALGHWLEFWGLRVNSLDSPEQLQQALAEARPNTLPAVIIVGARESEATDPAWLELIKGCGAHAPLLVMLSSASLDLRARLRAGGAAGCLPKSASHEALQEELLRLTGIAQSGRRLKDRSVLVADNNLPNRRYIAALCTELGLKVSEAADGAQALRLWSELQPDYVLLDARMPVMNGAECAREIRQREAESGRHCRIYAISAHLEPDERREFLEAGADSILLKPFDGNQLAELLKPDDVQTPQTVATVLTSDPSMLQLLLEDLPEQFSQLESAMGGSDAVAARDAAHQLHGTASFYHLAALKDSCASLERQLVQLAAPQLCAAELQRVRGNLHSTLGDIRGRLSARPAA